MVGLEAAARLFKGSYRIFDYLVSMHGNFCSKSKSEGRK